ncbi:hypothetical protein SGRA_3402 [Saprospira grandis str. Lewin]|uniref:Uncharacterized protein n=1 Tax=Saprospira grandis (strain Lewin) TaxID=984262 RepID=H6L1P9_SAPGL|nr:hypothetical protein SGRA_3402 [Saprospira grandis str. Lewin]
MDFLEQEMKNDIPDPLNQNFIPYYQLHEFEGLLFNNIETFDDLFTILKDTKRHFMVQ